MNYKPSARSPHYGKIFAYDVNGKEMKELDILKVDVVHEGRTYKIGQLLEDVIELRKEVDELNKFKNEAAPQLESVRKKVATLTQLMVMMDAKIKSLEVIK